MDELPLESANKPLIRNYIIASVALLVVVSSLILLNSINPERSYWEDRSMLGLPSYIVSDTFASIPMSFFLLFPLIFLIYFIRRHFSSVERQSIYIVPFKVLGIVILSLILIKLYTEVTSTYQGTISQLGLLWVYINIPIYWFVASIIFVFVANRFNWSSISDYIQLNEKRVFWFKKFSTILLFLSLMFFAFASTKIYYELNFSEESIEQKQVLDKFPEISGLQKDSFSYNAYARSYNDLTDKVYYFKEYSLSYTNCHNPDEMSLKSGRCKEGDFLYDFFVLVYSFDTFSDLVYFEKDGSHLDVKEDRTIKAEDNSSKNVTLENFGKCVLTKFPEKYRLDGTEIRYEWVTKNNDLIYISSTIRDNTSDKEKYFKIIEGLVKSFGCNILDPVVNKEN